jgi:choline kinase
MKKASIERAGKPILEAPLGQLERALIEEFLQVRGYNPVKLAELPEAERETLLNDASVYASAKLAEAESRSHFLHEIHE